MSVKQAETAFREALQWVGGNPRKNGVWFLEFTQRQLRTISGHEERQRIWEGLLALTLLATRSDKLAMPLSDSEQRVWREAAGLWRLIRTGNPKGPEEGSFEYRTWWQAVLQIQVEVRKALKAFQADGQAVLPLKQAVYQVSQTRPGRILFPLDRLVIGAGGIKDVRSGVESAVLLRLGQVLDRLGPLRRCKADGKGCQHPVFFASRTDKVYCSRTCGMREFMREQRRQKRQAKRGKRRRPGKRRLSQAKSVVNTVVELLAKPREIGGKRGNPVIGDSPVSMRLFAIFQALTKPLDSGLQNRCSAD